MQALYELVHSLTKDEKRLYHQAKRNPRLQALYEGYLAADLYDRQVDRDIYEKHFKDVSRAFYSMQKRALMDDILSTLLLHTNLQDGHYRFARAIARALLMIERRNGEGAQVYLDEAEQVAREGGMVAEQAYLLELQKKTLPLTPEATAESYLKIIRTEQGMIDTAVWAQKFSTVQIIVHLLRTSGLTSDTTPLITLAEQYLQELYSLEQSRPDVGLQLELFAAEAELKALQEEAETHHRKLLKWFGEQEKTAPAPLKLKMVNTLLASGLRAGDFLLLSALTYKTSKQLNELDRESRELHLADYYEHTAVYHFYENDLPAALHEIEQAVELSKGQPEQLERRFYYRLAMFVAGYLPTQARETIRRYQKQLPQLENDPLLHLFRFLIEIESHTPADNIIYEIRKALKRLPKSRKHRQFQEACHQLLAYLENKPVPRQPIRLFPAHWENLLQLDLWLEAKQKNQFYYNLLRDDWEKRKQVFG